MLTNLFRARDRAPEPACAQAQAHVQPTTIEALAHGTLASRPAARRDTQDRHYTAVRVTVTGAPMADDPEGSARVRMFAHGPDVTLRVVAYEHAAREALRNLKQGAPITVVGSLQLFADGLGIVARDITSLPAPRNTP